MFDFVDQAPATVAEVRAALHGESTATTTSFRDAVFDIRISPIRDKDGDVQGAIGTVLDVTDRLAAIGTLVAGVAHEVNNPLTGIFSYADLLLRERGDLDQSVRDDLLVIRDEARRAADIVSSLSTFAQQRESSRSSVDLNAAAESVARLQVHRLHLTDVELMLDLQPDLSAIVGDPGEIRQVLLNLAINAEQALEDATGEKTITIRTFGTPDLVHLTISDTGPGIPPEALSQIFDPFYTTKPVGKGTGLGLSICHGIVEAHGGVIRAASEPGHGATFTLEFPIAAQSDEPTIRGEHLPASREET